MKLYKDQTEQYEFIDSEIKDPNGCEAILVDSKAYNIADIQVLGYYLTWEEFDELKRVMNAAEKRWRK